MLLPHRTPLLHKLFTSNILVTVKPKYFTPLPSPPPPLNRLFNTPLSPLCLKPISTTSPFSLNISSFSSIPPSIFGTTVSEVGVDNPEKKPVRSVPMRLLMQKLKEIEIDFTSYKLGEYSRLLCPKSPLVKRERLSPTNKTYGSVSVKCLFCVHESKVKFMYSAKAGIQRRRAFPFSSLRMGILLFGPVFELNVGGRAVNGWAGQVFSDVGVAHKGVNQTRKLHSYTQLTEEKLQLEPLGDELTAYFAGRMISKEILQRNFVMQTSVEKNVIAFTYRRNGELVECKYRSIINKRFWKEKGAEKILYGLDDIKEAGEIIIVEGEIDKLSTEQAGLVNCVSVPNGAPQKVSTKELPSIEKDTRFQYLWNCKDYLDKASRIILATDGDKPGQALAEELARRLGKERCWLVSWPKKGESSCFKDANEVLQSLGPGALRDIIDNAQLYQSQN